MNIFHFIFFSILVLGQFQFTETLAAASGKGSGRQEIRDTSRIEAADFKAVLTKNKINESYLRKKDIHKGYQIIELCTPYMTDEDYRQLGFDILLKGFGFGGINPITLVNPKEARIVSDFIEHYIKAGFKAEDIRNQGSWETPRRLNESHVGVIETIARFMERVRNDDSVFNDTAEEICKIAHNPYGIKNCNGSAYLDALRERLNIRLSSPSASSPSDPSSSSSSSAPAETKARASSSAPTLDRRSARPMRATKAREEDSSKGFRGSHFVKPARFSDDEKRDIIWLSRLAHDVYKERTKKEELFAEHRLGENIEFLGVYDSNNAEGVAIKLIGLYDKSKKELIIAVRGTVSQSKEEGFLGPIRAILGTLAGGDHGLANIVADIGIGYDMPNSQIFRDIEQTHAVKINSQHVYRGKSAKETSKRILPAIGGLIQAFKPEEGTAYSSLLAKLGVEGSRFAISLVAADPARILAECRRTLREHIRNGYEVGVARKFKAELLRKGKEIRSIKFTGHSLGGYLAQVFASYEIFLNTKSSERPEIYGYSFNGPGVNKRSLWNLFQEFGLHTAEGAVAARRAEIESSGTFASQTSLDLDHHLISVINTADLVGSLGFHSGRVWAIDYADGLDNFPLDKTKTPRGLLQLRLNQEINKLKQLQNDSTNLNREITETWSESINSAVSDLFGATRTINPEKERKLRELSAIDAQITRLSSELTAFKATLERGDPFIRQIDDALADREPRLPAAELIEAIDSQHSIRILRDYLSGIPELRLEPSAAAASRSDSPLRFTGGAASRDDDIDDG